MGKLDNLYKYLPVPAQNGAVSLYGLYWKQLRFGPGYTQSVMEYSKRNSFDFDEWNVYQQDRLKDLLTLAAERVPYYREHWSKSEKAAAKECGLSGLPLLEKEPLRSQPEAFVREGKKPFGVQTFLTSGSTGTPISSLYTIQELRETMAVREVRSAGWAGVSFKRPRATFSGRIAEPNPESRGPFYRYNLAERQVYLSPFHLRPDTAADYIEALKKNNAEWLTGYAVSYYLLAKFILEQGLEVPPLKAVITTSEKVTAEMRAVMQLAYRCRVFEEYSTVENVLFASECEHGRLHVSLDAGIVEILRPDGSPCGTNEPGEIVTTSLIHRYQVYVRYRLGDVGAWDGEPCPCGRYMPVIKEVIGRVEDVVIGTDGRQMVRFHGIFVNQPHVREGQIIQEALDTIRVKVVPTDNFTAEDFVDIQKRVQQRLGAQTQVVVEPVEFIPRTASGKFQAVISLINKKSA